MTEKQQVEKPVWQAPRIVSAGHLTEIVSGKNKGSKQKQDG